MKEGVSGGRDSIYNNILSVPPTYYSLRELFQWLEKCVQEHIFQWHQRYTLKTRILISLSTIINEILFILSIALSLFLNTLVYC